MRPPSKPGAPPLTRGEPIRLRRLALISAILSLFSAYCQRFAGGDVGTVATPHPDGHSPCNNDVECASYSCQGGVCVPPRPGLVEIDGDCSGGDPCVGDARCDNGICVATSKACAADNTGCEVDEDCCNDICTGGVCGFGGDGTGGSGGGCAGLSDFCTSGSDCCSGYCDTNVFECASSCTAGDSGADCSSDGDCCSDYCDFSSYTCE